MSKRLALSMAKSDHDGSHTESYATPKKDDPLCGESHGNENAVLTSSIASPSIQSVASNEKSKKKTGATIRPGVDDPVYVVDPGPNDILLGRGAPIINYEGNIRFRALVSTRKQEYVSSGRHQVKDIIAKSIVDEIDRRGGRFLKQVKVATSDVAVTEDTPIGKPDSDEDISKLPPESVPKLSARKLYQVAEYDVVIEKVKQALRDKDTMQHQEENRDDRGISSVHDPSIAETVLSQRQQHSQFLDLKNHTALSTVARAGIGADANTVNLSNDFMQTHQLQMLFGQAQNQVALDNFLLLNHQQRLQREQNQRFISLLNQLPVQSTTVPQQLPSFQPNSLNGIFPSQSPDTETMLSNFLRNRQRAELLAAMDRASAPAEFLSRYNVMVNPYSQTPAESRLANMLSTSLLESNYHGVLDPSALAAGLGIGGMAPMYPAAAPSPSPRMDGAHVAMADLIRSASSTNDVSSLLPTISSGNTPFVSDEWRNQRQAVSDEGKSSVSQSEPSSSTSSDRKEANVNTRASSRKRFKTT